MTFKELKKAIEKEFGVVKLADIAREFDVSPQVINNWKAREQVPYKYVKIFNEKIKEKHLEAEKSAKFFFQKSLSFDSKQNDDDISISDYIFTVLRYTVIHKVLIISAIIISLIFGKLYLRFISLPIYETEATILPINKGSSSNNFKAMAGKIGLSLGGEGNKLDLSSGQLVPEIVNSRKLARSLLFYEFDTREFGKKKKLISIIKKDTVTKVFSEHQIRSATKSVRSMIRVRVQKRSPILILRVKGSDKYFIPKLLDAVINELDNMVSNFKLSQNIEKKSFIGSRTNDVLKSLKKAEDKYENFKQTNRKILQSPSLIIEEQRLLREIELQTKVYITLKTEFQMAEIEEAGNASIIQILDEPEIPLKKLSPKPNQIYISSFLIGIIISAGLIFFKQWLAKNLKDLKNIIYNVG